LDPRLEGPADVPWKRIVGASDTPERTAQPRPALGSAMGDNYLDILLFAAVAAFLVFRLRNVLGKRVGHERPEHAKRDRFDRNNDPARDQPANDSGDKIIPLPDLNARPDLPRDDEVPTAAEQPSQGGLAAGLQQIRRADPGFTPEGFVEGARAAFEMVVQAFAAGDLKMLKPLLSEAVFDQFRQAIKAREAAGQKLETTLVGIDKAEIVEAELRDRTAIVTVSFRTEQVNVIRDAGGEAVDGDPTRVDKVTDIWTFSRNTRSHDPNWTLIATRSPN
jgi:predicted lipid-binding transport protein (Tim44 family)